MSITRRRLLAALAGSALVPLLRPMPAAAQWAVFDEMAAELQLRQIWNEVESLGHQLAELNNWGLSLINQAQQLVNEARMLATLPLAYVNQVRAYLAQGTGVISAALGLGRDVVGLQDVFTRQYPALMGDLSWQTLTRQTTGWVANTHDALEAATRIQADASRLIETNARQIETAVAASAAAAGVTQAVQSQTAVLAGVGQQITTLTTLLSTQEQLRNTAMAQAQAERSRAEEIGRRTLETFNSSPWPTVQANNPFGIQ